MVAILVLVIGAGVAVGKRAVVIEGELPGVDGDVGRILGECARGAGYEVGVVGVRGMKLEGVDLVVVPCAKALPLSVAGVIEEYVDRGGDLLVAGLPGWGEGVMEVGGRYMTCAEYEAAVGGTTAERVVVDFGKEDLRGWRHSTDRAGVRSGARIEGGVMHVVVEKLTGWDTYSRRVEGAFGEGRTLTCFRAKGGEGVTQLALEWRERDGTRWIATVGVGQEWKDYAIGPERFVAWQPPRGRGGIGDRMRVEEVEEFSVGVAFSHTDVGRGRHEWWFGGLGTARHPFGGEVERGEVPVIEGVSPGWEVFEMRDVGVMRDGAGNNVTAPAAGLALQPRPRGTGVGKARTWRWEPLLEAWSSGGELRGTVGVMMVRTGGAGGTRICFTPGEAKFYRSEGVQQLVRESLQKVRRGVFLGEGGAGFYTVMEGQKVPIGGKVVRSRGAEGVEGKVVVTVEDREGRVVYQREGEGVEEWVSKEWPVGGYVVRAELWSGGEVVDRVEHELHVWRPVKGAEFVRWERGHFRIGEKVWKVHGVNYMPSSGIGLSEGEVFEHWIGAKGYDPVVVGRDLRRIRGMGLNAVSVFIYRGSMEAGNLRDFLRQCREVGLRVNLSIRPGTPMEFGWKRVREVIEHYRLAENETVVAYDLAWEPTHGDHAQREKAYGRLWDAWVGKRYGSREEAERVWGVKCEGVPAARWMVEDGEWRKVVADYRLFLDQVLAERYGKARELVRSIDAKHAVSFRMNIAGDPTARDPNMLAYDFWGLRGAVDFFGPEAYGRIGDWESVRPGMFTAAYARLCNPELPVVWTEVGVSSWDIGGARRSEGKEAFKARYYRDVYRMLGESGADGVFFWWYPGGYRVNERSDFGIINEDGTDREVTKVIREEGRKWMEKPVEVKGERVEIGVERDGDARGLFGMYEKVKGEFWKANQEGKVPVLMWNKEPG